MKMDSRWGAPFALALIVVTVGVALSAVEPATTVGGWHRVTLSSTTYSDSGVGFTTFRANAAATETTTTTSDTATGAFYLRQATFADTGLANLADSRSGFAQKFYGAATGGVATLYAQTAQRGQGLATTDTGGRITASLTLSASDTGAGTWSSTFSGASAQTAASSFMTSAAFSSKRIRFGLSADTTFPLFDSLVVVPRASDSVVLVRIDSGGGTDTFRSDDFLRLMVENPAGRMSYDTQMVRVGIPLLSETSALYTSSAISFETGTSTMYLLYWDAHQGKYKMHTGRVATGETSTTVTSGSTASSGRMGNITNASVTTSSAAVSRVQFIDSGNDAGANQASDVFLTIDSGTFGFETRVANSVFEINLFDASNNRVRTLPTGQSYLVVIQYDSAALGLSTAAAARLELLHHNEATNTWERVATSSVDPANSRIVATVSSFSKFAVGTISASGSASSPDDGDCIIQNTFGGTFLSGVMPSMRGMRDAAMNSALGRFFVTGYYGSLALFAVFITTLFGSFAVVKRG
jgi:hypothetical protein